ERVPKFTLRDAEKLARNIAILSEIQQTNWKDDYYSYITMLGIFAYTFYKTDFESLEKAEYSQELICRHFINYSDKNGWESDDSLKAIVFTILMARVKLDPNQKFHATDDELESRIRQLRASILSLSDIHDLREFAQILPMTYRAMLNLA
ncbi:hypothetical protein, partial [Vibrio parahaemolyticus]|uniref:hypothetical protein n=1 Tax=Vibrio parahaemolyticus TaxID=670 RepID=UPI001173D29C